MNEAAAREVMEYATRFCGMSEDHLKKTRKTMIDWASGMTPQEIAAADKIKIKSVWRRIHRGLTIIRAHHWTPFEKDQLAQVAERILSPGLTDREYAEGILDAARNARKSRDEAPEVDENLRPIAQRGPLVNADDVLAWLYRKPFATPILPLHS